MGFFDGLLKTTRLDSLAKDFKWNQYKNAYMGDLCRASERVFDRYRNPNSGIMDFNPHSNTTKQMIIIVLSVLNQYPEEGLEDTLQQLHIGFKSDVCNAMYKYLTAPTSLTEHQTEDGKDLADTIKKLNFIEELRKLKN